jgi:diguanylate cyclase (GGDEF)-like protein/PAS domain S-box-containing protein
MTSELPIERVIQHHLLDCAPETPLSEAARRMHAAGCSSIVVIEDGRAVGIWTERDALAVDFSDPAMLEIPIARVMASPVKTIHYKTPIGEATVRFRDEGVRHFLVVGDSGEHLGIVTQSDIVLNQGIEYYILLRDVKSVLRGEPLTIPGAASLEDAAAWMREARADAVVVTAEDGSHGILTERDIVRLIAERRTHASAWDLASKPLITVPGDSSLYYARSQFTEKQVRHLGVTGPHGELIGLVTFADILASIEYDYVRSLQEALKKREQDLAASNHNLRLAEKVYETTFEGILITDANSVIESVNPAFTKITGYRAQEVIGRKPSILSSGRHPAEFYQSMWADLLQRGYWQGEVWNRRKNGEIYPEWLSISAVKDSLGKVTNYVAIFSDITERKAAEEHVRHLAHHDPLTGLPNRILFMERVGHAIAHAHRAKRVTAVMFLDLDRFKIINDTLGHTLGDQLLQVVSKRLVSCVREDDTVARLGGDEFTIVLEDVADAGDIGSVAEKIIRMLSQPMTLEGHEIFVTTSIGIAIYPDDGDTADTLIKHADAAMYRAKDKGRNNYQFFTADMNVRALERLTMENSLRKALERNEFVLYYQPQVDINTHRITGMEALLRWRHPELGLVSPAQFIPIAEESGLIVPIGEWVLRAACAQNKAWQDAGFPALRVAVNISARQFKQPNLVGTIAQVLADTGLNPRYLELEITENIAMEHAEDTVEKLRKLKEMGIRISIDDFGTGHSSLSYLKRFPIDAIKIDRSFVTDLSPDQDSAAIAAAISAMANSLKLKVITEGVETEEQLALLMTHNRDEVQGYYFSQPLPADAFAALLKDGKPLGK